MTRRSPLPAGTLTGNHPRGESADCDQHILHNCCTLNDLMTPEHLGSRERGGSEIFLVTSFTGLLYRYQVTDSGVMKTKQIFFTLSPDGLTQFALDNTTFIDLNR